MNTNTQAKLRVISSNKMLITIFLIVILQLIATPLRAQNEDDLVINLFTEDFPPYSMTIDGSASATSSDQITGFMTDIVREVFRRSGINYTLELVPWKRAYDTTLAQANSGVFTTTRTAEREDSFAWISPLINANWALVSMADRQIRIDRLEDAAQYRIGGYFEDAIAAYLEAQGLEIDYVPNDILNLRKLARGRIDLWPVVMPKGLWLAETEGVPVKELYTILVTKMGLAMNLETDPEVLRILGQEMLKMHDDGTVAEIIGNYLDGDLNFITAADD